MSGHRQAAGADGEHELLCRLFGAAPVRRHQLAAPVSDFAFWQSRLEDRRGEVVFGLVTADNSGMILTHNPDYPAKEVFRVPSGGIAHDETVADCLAREVQEELGTSFEVWGYAGRIDYCFSAAQRTLTFPSYCFLLRQPPGAAPEPLSLACSNGEIDAWLAATPAQLQTYRRRLQAISGEWADWGSYRAISTGIVAASWRRSTAAAAGACESPPERWPRDLSMPVGPGMAAYGDDPRPQRRYLAQRTAGQASGWLVSEWTLSAHAGTHVDAPSHWFADGAAVDRLDLTALCGPAVIVDCRLATAARRPVTIADLRLGGLTEPAMVAGRAVLVQLGLGDVLAAGQVPPEHSGLTAEAATDLVKSGAVAVGIEALTVDPPGITEPTVHPVLLGAGLPVIEGLNLTGLRRGQYWLNAAPLHLRDAEAAPCRALLWPSSR